MKIDTKLTTMQDWTIRFRQGSSRKHVLLLLHGFTGNENAMWIFTEKLPETYWIFSPRALYPAGKIGYSWTSVPDADFSIFRQSAQKVRTLIDQLVSSFSLTPKKIDLIGFSQGAALAYTLALTYPAWTGKTAALSGFLPHGAETIISPGLLSKNAILVTHGSQDQIIPFSESQKAIAQLGPTRAELIHCQEDTGHRLHTACRRQLIRFFEQETGVNGPVPM